MVVAACRGLLARISSTYSFIPMNHIDISTKGYELKASKSVDDTCWAFIRRLRRIESRFPGAYTEYPRRANIQFKISSGQDAKIAKEFLGCGGFSSDWRIAAATTALAISLLTFSLRSLREFFSYSLESSLFGKREEKPVAASAKSDEPQLTRIPRSFDSAIRSPTLMEGGFTRHSLLPLDCSTIPSSRTGRAIERRIDA